MKVISVLQPQFLWMKIHKTNIWWKKFIIYNLEKTKQNTDVAKSGPKIISVYFDDSNILLTK